MTTHVKFVTYLGKFPGLLLQIGGEEPSPWIIDCRAIDLGQVPKEVGRALEFPAYYGNNWDAMDECIRDLSWLPVDFSVVIAHCGDLEASDPESFGILVEIFSGIVSDRMPSDCRDRSVSVYFQSDEKRPLEVVAEKLKTGAGRVLEQLSAI